MLTGRLQRVTLTSSSFVRLFATRPHCIASPETLKDLPMSMLARVKIITKILAVIMLLAAVAVGRRLPSKDRVSASA